MYYLRGPRTFRWEVKIKDNHKLFPNLIISFGEYDPQYKIQKVVLVDFIYAKLRELLGLPIKFTRHAKSLWLIQNMFPRVYFNEYLYYSYISPKVSQASYKDK